MRKTSATLCLVVLGFSEPLAAQSYQGNIDVLLSSPGYIQLNPDMSLMPGESATFKVTGQVDVNHEHYEVRRCKWFGLDCWYEKRSVPHMQPAKAFEVVLTLRSEDGRFDKEFTKRAGSDAVIKVTYPDSHNFTTPAVLTGVLNFKGMNRTPCSGRPRFCSAGTLKVTTTETDVSARQRQLRNTLRGDGIRALDPVLVRSDVFVDPLLTDSLARRNSLQRIFSDELDSVSFDTSNQQFARNFVDIAKFAVGLDSDSTQVTKLNNKILEAYVALGDWSRITDEGGNNLEIAASQCERPTPERIGNFTPACQDYAKMLKLNAIGWLERRARYSSTEIRVALGMLEQATLAVNAGALSDVSTCRSNVDACKLAASLYVDGARMLTVLRTTAELEKAEQWLVRALDIHRAIPDSG